MRNGLRAFAAALCSVIEDPQLRTRLVTASHERAKAFSPEAIAPALLRAYEAARVGAAER